MEELIRELNNPANSGSSNRINEIQKQIQRLQRDKSAWQTGLDLLQHEEPMMRFYGALTLTIKVNADWDIDQLGQNEEMKSYLLEALIGNYVRLTTAADQNFVLLKITSTLATLFQKVDSGWNLALRHILACLINGQYVSQDGLPSIASIFESYPIISIRAVKGVMMVALTIAEDISGLRTNSTETDYLDKRMISNCTDAWQLLSICLTKFCGNDLEGNTNSNNSDNSDKDMIELTDLALRAIPPWCTYLKAHMTLSEKVEADEADEYARQSVHAMIRYINHEAVSTTALQTITTLKQSFDSLLSRSDPEYAHFVISSPRTENWISTLLQGNFTSEAIQYVDFLEAYISSIDFTSSNYLASEVNRQVLQILERLLHCPGDAVIDDPVCQIALDAIIEITEEYEDPLEDPDENEFLHRYIASCCSAFLVKARIPTDELATDTQTWDTDDRVRFQAFRLDVTDFFQSSFRVLSTALVEEIAKPVLNSSGNVEWSIFEAGLFCLTAFSDLMAEDPETYDSFIMAIFNSPQWIEVMQATSPVPDRVRQTSIKFISEITGYLQRHSTGLVPSLNFLFSSLQQPASSSAASRAIYTLCAAQRSTLAEALPQFLESLSVISNLGASDRHRIYGGVAAIIQALPTEDDKIQPLVQILDMVANLQNKTTPGPTEVESQVEFCTDIMQTLAAIGKGLRAPADIPVDVDDSESKDDQFWTVGPGSAVQRRAFEIFGATIQELGSQADYGFVEAACDFIRSGFPEDHPSPFKFSNSIVLQLLSQQITLDSPNIDAVMGCASSFLASAKTNELGNDFSILIYPVTQHQQQIVSEQYHGHANSNTFASSSLDFLARLIPKWSPILFSMSDSQNIINVAIELALMVMTESDTLPRRCAATFFASLVDITGPGSKLTNEAQSNSSAVIQTYGPRILALILRLVCGECSRSELESIAEPLKKFILRQPMLSKTICKEAMKDDSHVLGDRALQATSLDQRLRFVAQVLGLRGARMTIDVVRVFWISCRGSGFGYIA